MEASLSVFCAFFTLLQWTWPAWMAVSFLFLVPNDPWNAWLPSILGTCHSKCLQKTSSLNITWSLLDMENLCSYPRPFESESAFYQYLQVSGAHIQI